MQLLTAIIAVELLGMLLSGNGFSLAHPPSLATMRHRLLAEADSTPSADSTTPDASTPGDAEQTTPSDTPAPQDSSPQDVTPPQDQTPSTPDVGATDTGAIEPPAPETPENTDQVAPPLPSEDLPSFEPAANITPPSDTIPIDNSSSIAQPEPTPTEQDQKNTADVSELTPPVAPDVTTPELTITDVARIDAEVIEKVRIEDTQLSDAQTPEAKTDLLINFANESVDDVNTSLEKNNFSGVNFLVQRLDDQITNALSQLEQAAPDQQPALQAKIQKFSQVADSEIRTQQLVVPEELEQDMEIARGRLLLLQ